MARITRWLTRQQLAEKLGVHPNTIRRYETSPDFPKRSMSLGVPRWDEAKVDRFMRRKDRAEAREQARAQAQQRTSGARSSRPPRPLIAPNPIN